MTGKAHAAPTHAARNWLCSPKRLLGNGRGGIDRPVDLRCADRNINPALARKLQRDRQNILLHDDAIARTMSRSATAGRARPVRGRADSRRRADHRQGRDSVSNGTSRHVRSDEQAVCTQSRAFVTRSVQVSRVLVARCDLAQCDLARPGVSAEHLRVSCALPVLPGSLRCWPLKRCSSVLGNSFSCFK